MVLQDLLIMSLLICHLLACVCVCVCEGGILTVFPSNCYFLFVCMCVCVGVCVCVRLSGVCVGV